MKPPSTPTKSPSKEVTETKEVTKEAKETEVKEPEVSDQGSSGYLTSTNIASGVKILLMKNHIFYSASVVCISGNNVCGVKFRNNTFSDIQYFSEADLTKISVLEREIINGMSLTKSQRVAVASKSNLDTFTLGTVVDFR